MIPNVGPLELIIVLVIALLVLGPKRLPEVGRSVGKGMRDFKSALSGEDDARAQGPARAPLEGEAKRGSDANHGDEPDPRREVTQD
jgi:sec-independent protein translocase protein TatA